MFSRYYILYIYVSHRVSKTVLLPIWCVRHCLPFEPTNLKQTLHWRIGWDPAKKLCRSGISRDTYNKHAHRTRDISKMATSLPEYPPFDINCDQTSLSQRWKKWVSRFINLLLAMDISDAKRMKALLHYAGQDVHDVFDTLPKVDTETLPAKSSSEGSTTTLEPDEYLEAKTKLDNYFNPKLNVEYEWLRSHQGPRRRERDQDQRQLYQNRSVSNFSPLIRDEKMHQPIRECLCLTL